MACRHLAATAMRWIRASWGYRWLQSEPNPEVIVIDLRETWTVGPPLRGLDRGLAVAMAALVASHAWRLLKTCVGRLGAEPLRFAGIGLCVAAVVTAMWLVTFGTLTGGRAAILCCVGGVGLLGMGGRRSCAELGDTRPGRALAALFVPPEPPTDAARTGGDVETERGTETDAETSGGSEVRVDSEKTAGCG